MVAQVTPIKSREIYQASSNVVEPLPRPQLAHVVLNVGNIDAALNFYMNVFGYKLNARDDDIGACFLTDGRDHHTIALVERPSLLGILRSPGRFLKRLLMLIKSRRSNLTSQSGQKTVMPPFRAVRMAMQKGLQHIGYRVENEVQMAAYKRKLEAAGHKMVWAVNHGDMIKGMYFKDPDGNHFEIFCDGPEAKELIRKAQEAGGFDKIDFWEPNLVNFELDIDKEIKGAAKN